MTSQSTSEVPHADSGDDTQPSPVIVVEDGDDDDVASSDEFEIMKEQLENFKIVAAAWQLQVPDHNYSKELLDDINTLLFDIVVEVTLIDSAIEELKKWPVPSVLMHRDSLQVRAERVAQISDRWAVLKSVVANFIPNSDTDSDDKNIDDGNDAEPASSSSKRPRISD